MEKVKIKVTFLYFIKKKTPYNASELPSNYPSANVTMTWNNEKGNR